MNAGAVEIMDLSAGSPYQLKELLQESCFKPMRYLQSRLEGSLTESWLMSLNGLLQGGKARGLCAVQGRKAIGLLVYSDNPWETAVIGTKAGVINHFVVAPHAQRTGVAEKLLDKALEQASSSGIGLLLGRAHTDDYTIIHALESAGFHLVDTMVDCFFDFLKSSMDSTPALGPNVSLRRALPQDRAELVSLAHLAFEGHFGRFHADRHLGKAVATRVYEQWLGSSMDGYADWIDVAEISGKIAGFSVWKKPAPQEVDLKIRVGHYSISGIHPAYHGRGLFTALTHEGMKGMKGFADVLEGPTHINNHGVHAGYSKLGWRVGADARHSFHKWLG